jgi:hypothetical protein
VRDDLNTHISTHTCSSLHQLPGTPRPFPACLPAYSWCSVGDWPAAGVNLPLCNRSSHMPSRHAPVSSRLPLPTMLPQCPECCCNARLQTTKLPTTKLKSKPPPPSVPHRGAPCQRHGTRGALSRVNWCWSTPPLTWKASCCTRATGCQRLLLQVLAVLFTQHTTAICCPARASWLCSCLVASTAPGCRNFSLQRWLLPLTEHRKPLAAAAAAAAAT